MVQFYLLSNVELDGSQGAQNSIVFRVERSQWYAQPECRFGNERIQNAKAMTQVVC